MRSTSLKKTLIALITLSIFLTGRAPKAHAQSDRIVFGVIGDYGLAGQPLLDVSNLIKSWNPDFIVTTGDNNYPDGAAWSMDQNVGQYFHEYLFRYKGKYGSGSPTQRFFPSMGNHDWTTGGKAYLDFFGVHYYYEFIKGPVHFFVLDSDRDEPDGIFSDSVQARWLKKKMTVSTSPFQVVVFHHAPYSSGKHGPTEYMRWPFKEWGADAVLTGHDHVYERLLVDGLPYFVNGIGGAELYHFQDILPESQMRFNQDFGAMQVEATSAYMKFQMYSRGGTLVDEYIVGGSAPIVSSITRQNANPNNLGMVNFQVAFSESVTGVDVSDFRIDTTLNGASIINVSGSGNLYTVSVSTGTGDGSLRLDLTDDDSILSSLNIPLGGSGAANGNAASETYTIDRTPPAVISITPLSPSPTNAAVIDFAVTFSEPVSGVDLPDLLLTTSAGATITSITGSAASYLVSVATGTGNDTIRLDLLDNDSVIDLAGNTTSAGFTNGGNYIIDRSAPVVTSITPVNQTNTSSVDFMVSFSEPVTGVDGSDFSLFTINRAAITNVSGSGSQYAVSVAIQPGSDSIRLDLNDNDSIADAVGNPLGGAGLGNGNFIGGNINIAIDTPIVTSIIRAGASPTNAANVDFILTFSEPVFGVDISDFLLTGDGTITNINDSNPFFIITVSAANDGELKLDLIDDDSIRNADGISLGGIGTGNANFTSGETYRIDRTPPQITSIIRAGSNPAINSTADFIATFSEPVHGVELNDFITAPSNVIKSSVIHLQSADPFYWVTITTGAGSGTVRLDLFDNGNITDHAGNPLANNGFIAGESFNIAKTSVDFGAPSITAMPNAITTNPLVSLSWSSVRNASAYEIFIARDSGFSQILTSQVTLETKFLPAFPLADGTYHARVRAYNADLNPGKFSKTYTFTIDSTPPAPPKLLSPATGSITPRRPWLKWSAANGAVKYQLEVDNNADFSSPDFSATTNKLTLQTKALLGSRTYYWRVRAQDSAGNWSEWSNVFIFIPR